MMSNKNNLITKPRIYWSVYPFALIYGGIVQLRNKCFDWGILKSEKFSTPSICIGNISVGGTGKTPHTEYLIRLLQDEWRVAVLSRGYKRKSKGFQLAGPESTIEDIGDEPLQMYRKFSRITVAVDRDRRNGMHRLIAMENSPEVILLDDAFQHRYVSAGLNILLIDSHRPIHYDRILPAGRLRETESGQKRADIIIVTKCDDSMSQEKREAYRRLVRPLPHQKLYFTRFAYGELYALTDPDRQKALAETGKDTHLLLLTGIASPAPIIKELQKHTTYITNVPFPDHHDFTSSDLDKIRQTFTSLPKGKRMIVTTEKDATRLRNNTMLDDELKANIYVLPITVEFLNDEKADFDAYIAEYMRESEKKI